MIGGSWEKSHWNQNARWFSPLLSLCSAGLWAWESFFESWGLEDDYSLESSYYQTAVFRFISFPHEIGTIWLVQLHESVSLAVIELRTGHAILAVEARMIALAEQIELLGNLGKVRVEGVKEYCELSLVLLQANYRSVKGRYQKVLSWTEDVLYSWQVFLNFFLRSSRYYLKLLPGRQSVELVVYDLGKTLVIITKLLGFWSFCRNLPWVWCRDCLASWSPLLSSCAAAL